MHYLHIIKQCTKQWLSNSVLKLIYIAFIIWHNDWNH